MLPSTSDALKIAAEARDIHAVRRAFLDPSSESLLNRVMQAEVDYQRNLHDGKVELSTRLDFSVSAARDAIDLRHPKGRIDRYEIQDFVRSHTGAFLTEADLDSIIRRGDIDGDE